jgi:hypothetical protein
MGIEQMDEIFPQTLTADYHDESPWETPLDVQSGTDFLSSSAV